MHVRKCSYLVLTITSDPSVANVQASVEVASKELYPYGYDTTEVSETSFPFPTYGIVQDTKSFVAVDRGPVLINY